MGEGAAVFDGVSSGFDVGVPALIECTVLDGDGGYFGNGGVGSEEFSEGFGEEGIGSYFLEGFGYGWVFVRSCCYCRRWGSGGFRGLEYREWVNIAVL